MSFVGLPIAAIFLNAGAADAQTIAPGFNQNQLARNDDGSTGAVALPFTANFFGTTYSELFVNNNGNVTFGASSGSYTPVGLGEAYRGLPIIAPFFSDVDTRNAASGVTSYGTGTYAGQTAFGVTWPSVGYYNSQADRTNTFQLILTNRGNTGAGNFDIYFNYGRIQWETGDADGGTNGLGGTSASAGFSAGTGVAGSYYELPGSLVNGAFIDGGPNSLVTGTNNGVPGQFLFPVRNGVVLVANVCQTGDNASTTSVANCGPNQTYNAGVFYTPTGRFTLSVLANTTVEALPDSSAVLIMPAAVNGVPSAGNIRVTVDPTATIRSADGAGIEIDGTYGRGSIGVVNGGTISAGTHGITAHGVLSPAIALNNASGGSIEAGSIGMLVGTQVGRVSLTNAGSISAGYAGLVGGTLGYGPAGTAGGNVAIANSGTVTFGNVGLLGGNGLGATTITNSGSLAQTGTPGSPPNLSDLPPVIAAGIGALGNQTFGMLAVTGVGPITAINTRGGTISGEFGIATYTFGAGIVSTLVPPGTPLPETAGPVSIENRGTINASTAGISASAFVSGAVNISNSGGITAGSSGAGITAFTQATTDFTIGNSGTISAGGIGVNVMHQPDASGEGHSGQTLVTNQSGGSISGGLYGVSVQTYDGAVTLRNAGSITGGSAGLALNNVVGSALTIENLAGGTISAANGRAIATSWDGTATVSNAGAIAGYVRFGPASSETTGPAVTFNNLKGGLLATAGESIFGTNSVFDNSGTVSLLTPTGGVARAGVSTLASGTSSATFYGLSEFRNSGTINLANGYAGDTFTINGNYVGQNGHLVLDFSTQTSRGDQFVVNGNASGSTGITVANLTSAVPFTTTAPLVTVHGTSSADAFSLTSLRNFGTLEPVLSTNTDAGVTTLSLGAVPNSLGMAGPTATIAARTISFQGGQAVMDRLTELRQQMHNVQSGQPTIPAVLQYAGLSQYSALVSKDPITPNLVPPPPPSNVKPAVWARAFGDYESRGGSANFAFAGNSFSRNLGYRQSSGGFLAGADVVISGLTSADDGVVLGVMAGYTVAGVRLNQGVGRQDFEGGTVGAYATYLRGPFFLDTLFKVDLLGLDIGGPGLRQSTGLQNYNFTSNVGYRIPLASSFYVEPTAGVEYVNTNFDQSTALTGTTVALQDGDALRVRGGARFGYETIAANYLRIEPSLTAYAYSVVSESGLGGAFNGVTPVTGLKEEGKVRGELQGSLNVFNLKTGVSGFLRADCRFGEDLFAGGGRAGVRYTW